MNEALPSGEPKRIAVVGIGGVGGYFGGRLARHYHPSSRQDGPVDEAEAVRVDFVARGEHLEAIRRRGLLLNTAEQTTMICRPFQATDRIEELDRPDICLICVKGYDLDDVSRRLAPVVGPRTLVLPLLNGVDIRERIRRRVNRALVLPACVYVSASIVEPGVVTKHGGAGLLIYGQDPDHKEYRPDAIRRLFERAGIAVEYREDPYPAIWEKYLYIASFALVTAWAGKPMGAVSAEKRLSDLTVGIMEEIQAIAAQRGVRLQPGVVSTSLAKAKNLPYDTKTSYQRDVEKGGRNEGELFGATIIRLGRESGVPTPVTERLNTTIEARLHS